MKPGDLRLFEVDDDRLGEDMFSGKLALLLHLSTPMIDLEDPCWNILIGDRSWRVSEGMLERFTSPVQTGG